MSKAGVRWYFNLAKWSPSFQDMLLATSCIQPEEKLRLGKFVFNKDFKSSLVGRLMMRKYVSESCAVDYARINFSRDDKGRPILSDHEKLSVSFNVSHQGEYTVLAGELGDMLLGIDVMKIEYKGGKPLKEFFRIMTRNFSTMEWKQIYSSMNETEQLKIFCRLWSLKESYVKAIGVGITVKLDELSFDISSPLSKESYVDNSKVFIKGTELKGWIFREILLDDNHCVAVATNKDVLKVSFEEIDFKELMGSAKPFSLEDEEYCLNYFRKPEKSF